MSETEKSKSQDLFEILEVELKDVTEHLITKLKGKEVSEFEWAIFMDGYDEVVFEAIFKIIKETVKRT